MKLLGVTGNVGSGKTTFTEFLGQKDNIGVIHVDHLVGDAKKKYLRLFLQPEKNNTTDSTKKNPKLNINFIRMLYSNRILFSLCTSVRNKMIQKPLESKIEELKREGKTLIVIDDWLISTNKDLCKRLDKIYIVKRNFLDRRESMRLRDDATRTELRISDIPYANGYFATLTGDNVIEILNKGTLKDLCKIADKEYENLGELSFNERYSLRGRSVQERVESIGKTFGNTVRLNKSEKQKYEE